MNLTIDRSELRRIMSATAVTWPGSSAITQLAAAAESLAVAGYAPNVYLRARGKATVREPGTTAVNGPALAGIVALLPRGGEVTLTCDAEQLQILHSAGKFSLAICRDVQFPDPPSLETGVKVVLETDQLRELIESVAFCASKDQSRPALTCIHLQLVDGWLHATAADAYRLARARLAVNIKPRTSKTAVVPARVLAKVAAAMRPPAVTLTVAKDAVQLEDETTTAIIAQPTETAYPIHVLDHLPHEYPVRCVVAADALVTALRRCTGLGKTTDNVQVKLTLNTSGKLVVVGTGPTGEVEGTLNASLEDPETGKWDVFTIYFDPRLLLDGIKRVKVRARLEFAGPHAAARITDAEQANWAYYAMPLKSEVVESGAAALHSS